MCRQQMSTLIALDVLYEPRHEETGFQHNAAQIICAVTAKLYI